MGADCPENTSSSIGSVRGAEEKFEKPCGGSGGIAIVETGIGGRSIGEVACEGIIGRRGARGIMSIG